MTTKHEPPGAEALGTWPPAPPERLTREQVLEIRTRLRMTKVTFGRVLGVSPGVVRGWEQGVHPPPMLLTLALRALIDAHKQSQSWIDLGLFVRELDQALNRDDPAPAKAGVE